MYKDISSYYGLVDGLAITCENGSAVLNGFLNILNTMKDADGISERPFRPNSGGKLQYLLEEPLDDITAFQIKLELVQLAQQMDRATVLSGDTLVVPNREDGCFNVTLVLRDNLTGEIITGFFNLDSANKQN